VTADAILADLLAHGIEPTVTPDGTGIEVPAGKLSPIQRAAIVAHKQELITRLIETSQITAQLIAAAMRRCDQFGDDEAKRAQMRSDCLETPPHLQADLLQHFKESP
jgi:hypothetical protein